MDVTVLAELPPLVQVHLWSAAAALLIGPFAIYRQRRDRTHKVLGYAWIVALGIAALSSFGLHAVILHFYFGFGVIHLLAIWVLLQLFLGLRDAIQGRIAVHRARMAGLYWQGLTVAGVFTLLPGRVLNEALFGGHPEIGFWVILGFGAGLLVMNLRLSAHVPPVPGGDARQG